MVWITGTLGAVVGASLVNFLIDSSQEQVSLVGASGAVAALFGAHIASVMLNWNHDTFAMVNTIRIPTPKWWKWWNGEIPFPLSAKHIYR